MHTVEHGVHRLTYEFEEVYGLPGVCLIALTGPGVPNLHITPRGVENVEGSLFDDIVEGNDFGNRLVALSGNDQVLGHGGADVLDAGTGNDHLKAFAQATAGEGEPTAENYLVGGLGDDLLEAEARALSCYPARIC